MTGDKVIGNQDVTVLHNQLAKGNTCDGPESGYHFVDSLKVRSTDIGHIG
jgi:hypothetical protein